MGNSRFKFRVWDKIRNKFIESPEPTPLLQANVLLAYFKDEEYMNNYVIQFCTGLKDKNEKLIYEGDVVTYDWLTPIGQVWRTDGKHIVEWHDGFTVIGNIAGYDVEHGKTRNVEVIGNIYENKELLED